MNAKSIRILLVEDSEYDAGLMAAELTRRGYSAAGVVRVQTRAAFMAALAGAWDIILSDYRLPGFTGRDALEILEQTGEDIPFIVVSRSVGEELAVEMMKAGAQDYLSKDNMARLVPAIERALADRRQRDEKRALIEQLRDNRERLVQEKKARADAEEVNRVRNEFLARVSHELRTPLTAILGWATVLQRRPLDAGMLAQALASIEQNARVQAQIVDDLLDVSRGIGGTLRLDVCDVDLACAIRAAAEVIAPAAAAKDMLVRLDLADLGPVAADSGRVHQIVWNLLSNAVKFTPRGGHVDVTLTRESDLALVRVRDDGEGIAPDFLPHAFDYFSQADGSLTRRHGGLGIGLSIVRRLTELHGGTATVASDGPNKGATFTISLPIRRMGPCREHPAGG